MTDKSEDYPKDWARVELMVSPSGEMHAIAGDQEPGEGDRAYIGLERIKANRMSLVELKGRVVTAENGKKIRILQNNSSQKP